MAALWLGRRYACAMAEGAVKPNEKPDAVKTMSVTELRKLLVELRSQNAKLRAELTTREPKARR